MRIPNEIEDLIEEYIGKYNKRPKPFNYDQWNSFDQYKEYLKKELEEK